MQDSSVNEQWFIQEVIWESEVKAQRTSDWPGRKNISLYVDLKLCTWSVGFFQFSITSWLWLYDAISENNFIQDKLSGLKALFCDSVWSVYLCPLLLSSMFASQLQQESKSVTQEDKKKEVSSTKPESAIESKSFNRTESSPVESWSSKAPVASPGDFKRFECNIRALNRGKAWLKFVVTLDLNWNKLSELIVLDNVLHTLSFSMCFRASGGGDSPTVDLVTVSESWCICCSVSVFSLIPQGVGHIPWCQQLLLLFNFW